jgi:hypothetical protein
MAEHAHPFLLVTILVLATILLVFGMKYFSAARRGASIAAVQADFSEMKVRLTAIEKLLREVE